MTAKNPDKERCGRCGMSSVVDFMDGDYDPYEEERIEVDERKLRKISPDAVFGPISRRIDDIMMKLTWGR
jgi:hypothetical protein